MQTDSDIEDAVQTAPGADGEELYEMANLYPETTGLPMTVWVSPRVNARHDIRIKVSTMHGDRMDITNTAVVAVRPTPHVLAGQLAPADAQAVFQWISLNIEALVAYRDGQIDTARLIYRLQPLPAQPPATALIPSDENAARRQPHTIGVADMDQFPSDEFDVDLNERRGVHQPSGIWFSFYEYLNEEDWENPIA
jgi:hypothetical protein